MTAGMSRRQWVLATAAWSATGLAYGQGKSPAAARRVVLGQSVPLTGPAAEIGLAFAAGAKLYVDAWNSRPANASLQLDLRQLDDGYDAGHAAANASRLLGEGADVLFGFVGADAAIAADTAAQKSGVPVFAPFAAPDVLRDARHPNVFHVRPSLADEAFKMVRHCATLGQERIAVVAESDTLGRAGLDAVNLAIKELKLKPLVASASVTVNSAKVDPAVAAAVMKAEPQAVIISGLFQSTIASIRALRAAGYGGSFLNFSVVGIGPLFSALGRDINGVVASQVVPSPRSVATAVVREYNAAVDNSDQTPSYESLEGFIAAKAVAEAVRRAGRAHSRADLLQAMREMTDYDVGGFRINLRAGVRDTSRPIDLVTITADGRVIR